MILRLKPWLLACSWGRPAALPVKNAHADLAMALVGVFLVTTPDLQAGQGYGYLVTGAPAEAQVIDPESEDRVLVAWIDSSGSKNSILVEEYGDGVSPSSSRRAIFTSGKKLWNLKLESTKQRRHFLALSEGSNNTFKTRILKFDDTFRELDEVHWSTNSNSFPLGRMLDDREQIFLGSAKNSARGRYVDSTSLSAKPWFSIQLERPSSEYWDEEGGNYYSYSSSSSVTIPMRIVTGLDTAIAPDGTATAVYDFGGIRLKRYGPDKRLQKSVKLEGRPYSSYQKIGTTAVAVLNDDTTLLAWEWHEYNFVGAKIVTRSAIPFFRGLLPNGNSTPSIKLQPSSTNPDLTDKPTVGLRPDGTGAVAWTVRNSGGSSVWLLRLNAKLQAYEAPRLVDARPGFETDQPMIRGDGKGNLFLSWRCTSTKKGAASEIGILDLGELDRVPESPRIIGDGSKMQIHWSAPPASRITLWYSPTLAQGDAVALSTETGISGNRMIEHQPGSPKGFYWLSTE